MTSVVLATITGELTRDQQLWTAALHVGGDSLIGGYSCLEAHGLKNWHRDEITLLIDDEAHYPPIAGVTYFRTRRPLSAWRASTALPLARVAPAALLCAAHEPSWRTAQGLLAAVVQQQLTTAASLREQLERMKPLRRAPKFRLLLDELEGGAHSLAEIDVTRMCRDHGLPRPHRQRRRKDAAGKVRYTDCEWDLPDGTVIVLEVDGAFHMSVEHWEDDIQRQRRLSQPGRLIVRCTTREVRDEPFQLAADLKALGLGVLCA
ncbi:hypothetical protein N803_10350 [Knoellia subterranea KCTC 19937]|uniref:DUF559 domain-containing protein n=1 Tax=Knoellia subterranea KCTC 19937 TaxID=1385521 RepID=A0A0A0JL49_9MICO|nr:hypothetical protein N803_10350 [Knoellia subterranea KCTC 19937]